MSVIKLLPFLVLGILFLFGGHYLIYRSLAGVFNIVNPVLRSGLLAFLLLMPLGFFAVSVLAHFSQTALTRFLYVIASVWLGLAISLLLAAPRICQIIICNIIRRLAGLIWLRMAVA